MNELYHKNLELLKKHVLYLADREERLENVDISAFNGFRTKDNQTGMYMQGESGIWQFNSEYAAKGYAEIWWKQYKDISYNSTIVMFGLGSGQYLKTVLEHTEETNGIIVYEPSIAVFKAAMNYIDFEELVDKRVGFVIEGINEELLLPYQQSFIVYANHSVSKYIVYPGYNRLFKEAYANYFAQAKRFIESMMMGRNTEIVFAESNTKNLIQNFRFFYKSQNILQLIEKLPKDVPAIVIAAGPSLDKNIQELKKAKNRAFLIATDTALKPLLREGIVPDIFLTVDPEKMLVLFEDDRIWDIPICVVGTSNTRLLEKERNKIFFSYSSETFYRDIYQMYGKSYGHLDTGGSVANNAFSLAECAKMNPIIFVGQDLAFTNDKSHADGTFKDKMEKEDMDNERYVEVEDIYGNKVKTLRNLKKYKEWFETKISMNEELRVIDATEGGAKIIGTEILDLKTVLERECKKEINFSKIISDIPPFFEKTEREELKEFMQGLPEQMKKVRRRVSSGEKDYRLLMELFKKQDFESKEFKLVTRRIKRLNDYLEDNHVIALVEPYIKAVDYMVLNNIFEVKEDIREEGAEIGNNGIRMLQAIRKGIRELMPIVKDAIKELDK